MESVWCNVADSDTTILFCKRVNNPKLNSISNTPQTIVSITMHALLTQWYMRISRSKVCVGIADMLSLGTDKTLKYWEF